MSAQRVERDERIRSQDQLRLARTISEARIELVDPETAPQIVPAPPVLTPWGFLYIP